jgi:hypothetical protein
MTAVEGARNVIGGRVDGGRKGQRTERREQREEEKERKEDQGAAAFGSEWSAFECRTR